MINDIGKDGNTMMCCRPFYFVDFTTGTILLACSSFKFILFLRFNIKLY